MIVLELAFTTDERRLAARPAHRRRLAELQRQGMLTMAGPWEDDSGALLIFSTDEANLAEILATDPYYTTPGVEIRARRRWAPVIAAPDGT